MNKLLKMMTKLFLISIVYAALIGGVIWLISLTGSVVWTVLLSLALSYLVLMSIVMLLNNDRIWNWLNRENKRGKENDF